jgi:predicted nucleic acid-binding protein
MGAIWPVEPEDVELARALTEAHPALAARDLIHVACGSRRGVTRIRTYDRPLAAAFA